MRRSTSWLVVVGLLAAGCGDGSSSDQTDQPIVKDRPPSPVPFPVPGPGPTPNPGPGPGPGPGPTPGVPTPIPQPGGQRASCRIGVDLGADGSVDERVTVRLDAAGRPLRETWHPPGGKPLVQQWSYDAQGVALGWTRSEGPNGAVLASAEIASTADGRTETVTTFASPDAPAGTPGNVVETWTWDAAGRLVRYRREVVPPAGTTSTFDQRDWTYDDAGRLVGYAESGQQDDVHRHLLASTFELDAQGHVTAFHQHQVDDLNESFVDNAYQWDGDRLVGKDAFRESNTFHTVYVYDTAGHLVRADTTDSFGNASSASFSVDQDGRVTAYQAPGQVVAIAWDGDEVASRDVQASTDVSETFERDDQGRITRYGYALGDGPALAETWQWGDDLLAYERVVAGVSEVRYTFDAAGNLLSQHNVASHGIAAFDAAYTYDGDCTCADPHVAPLLEPVGPDASRACADPTDVPASWSLPALPEPELAGLGYGFPPSSGWTPYAVP